MMHCAVIFFVLTSAVLAANDGTNCSTSKCPKTPITHYRELGCTPIKDANQCCIERFDCPPRNKLVNGQCQLKKVIYENNGLVPKELIGSPCAIDCKCIEGQISCGHEQCAPYWRLECIIQRNKDICCPTGVVCDQAEIAKLATCEFEGKTYRVGQNMYSEVDKCVTCNCAEGFDGKLDSTFCHTKSCGMEIHYSEIHRDGCIPHYYGEDACCTIGPRCPESTDAVVTGIHKSGEDPALVCRFGNLTLRRGDSLTPGTERCTTCSCVIPPMVTCIVDPVCYEST